MDKEIFVEILLVEDNKHDAELAIMALKEYNLANNLVWVKNGKEALDFIYAKENYAGRDVNQQPQIILLDLKMPKVDGLEVLRAIRSDKRTRYVPVVVLTSSKEQKDIIESYELGVNSYIVKPVDFEQFVTCVKEIGYYWALMNQPPV